LLTSLITDDAVNPETRFGSLMGMRYSEDKLEPELQDTLFDYANLSNLNEVDQQLADSTLLVLGTLSGTTRDRGLERRLADRLMSAGDESSALVALSALGNSGTEGSGQILGRYLSDTSPSLRRRAAESLGQIPGDTAKLALAEHLSAERHPQVLGAMIESFGRRPLAREDLPPLIEKAVPSEPLVVRRAAISALAGQVPHLPEASSALRQIMTQTTDRQSLETIMGALYSGD
jgi:HEAT repeat protein